MKKRTKKIVLNKVLKAYEKKLMSWSKADLAKLAEESWIWFTSDGFEDDEKCSATTKKGIVGYILGWDPIATAGGLLDFLKENAKGRTS